MMPSSASLPLRERVGQLNQRLKGWEAVRWVEGSPQITDVLRHEVDRWGGIGAIYGVLRADPWSRVRWSNGIPPERSAEAYTVVQEHILRYGAGLPTLFVEEVPHGLMALGGTTLPVNLALGAGMDVELTEELAAHVAAETRARGTHVALVSGLDVLRDPRWGRAEECFSEDPALAAALVEATVRGMQGPRTHGRFDSDRIAVVAKHLAGQGAGIGGRNGSGAPIGRRELGEIHLRPAYVAARAGVAGFMAAYNDIDGIPCSANRDLLTGTLREDWGWNGIVMADGTAVDRLRDSAPDPASAAALAIEAGVDLSLWDEAFTHVEEAVDRGLLDEAHVTQAADRVLSLKERLGLLDSAATPLIERSAEIDAREFIVLADRAAAQSVVVVQNDGALPLPSRGVIAVIGPNADDLDGQLGDYTSPRPANDPNSSTIRSALIDRHGAANVRYARGSSHRGALDAFDHDAVDHVGDALSGADAAVIVLGGTSRRSYDDEFADNGAVDGPAPDTTNGEGVDLSRLALPESQIELLRLARAAVPVVIAILIDGRPRPVAELIALSDALIVAPFPGPTGGAAVVEALATGVGGGLLSASHPAVDGVMPVSHDERRETARGYVDARHPVGALLGAGRPDAIDVRVLPATPTVTVRELDAGAAVTIRVEVTNSTPSDVTVAVPLYGRRHELGIRPRRRSLLTVRRAQVPGESGTIIDFALGRDELGSWASGRPVAVPVELLVWADATHDPPEDAIVMRVADEEGAPGWEN